MEGRIHSFQSLGTVDGPGVRCVLFMQGCPLRCPYCHNPDTWDYTAGTVTDSHTAAQRILRCKPYFGTDGGVTVSGGEPLAQADFVYALFCELHEHHIHTALDTSGVVLNAAVEKLLTETDLVLLDIKFSTDAEYTQYLNTALAKPLAFLAHCQKKNIPVVVRQVITPGINDSADNVERLKALLRPYPCVEKIELLPFRKLCAEKYGQMQIPFPFKDRPEASAELMHTLNAALEK